tara:strand:+ start:12391 stop:13494 length:1104 start_codon:yes stop_codon:yes gene_type:complete
LQNLEKLAIDADLLTIDPSIQSTLDILISDYQNHSRLNDLGKFLVHKGLSKRLGIRLSMEMMSKNIPPFDQDGPIFITGLPRSGTSFLFDLLHAHSYLRSPFTWEIFQANSIAKNKLQILIKKIRTQIELISINRLVPQLAKIHPMHQSYPEECQLIMAYDLKSISFVYSANLPNYLKFISGSSFESSFRVHKNFLNALSTKEDEIMWLLKDPCHIDHIEEILNSYPKARFIFIHRNPKFSMPSISNLAYNLRLGYSDHVDPLLVGKQMLSYWQQASEKLLNSRELIPEDQMIDIKFDQLIDDPIKTVHCIFEKLSIKEDERLEEKMATRIESKKLKVDHSYSYKSFFKTSGEVENRFENYISHFDL